MKATLEEEANEQESRTNAEKQPKDKTVKLVSGMSLLKLSELWIRGLFQSELSSKGYGKGRGKGKPKSSIPKSSTAFTKTTADHCRRRKLKDSC